MKVSNSAKRWILRIVSIVYGLLVIPGVLLALSTVFLFDAPGSETSISAILLAFTLGITPIVFAVACVGGLACAFGSPSSKKAFWGIIFALLPVANLTLIVIVIVLLQMLCGGSFGCHV